MIDVPALVLAVLLAAQSLPAASPPAAAASPPTAPVELAVQVLDPKGEVPRVVQAGDLTVIEDGQPRPVSALAPLSRPWRIVIYVDRMLTGSRTLRAAAGSLAERARELAALGTVEVIVAEPQPRVVLPATRDAQAIDEALSKLWLSGEGRDDVRVLRQRFRDERGEEGEDLADRAEGAVEAEARLVRRQQDALAEWLVAQEGGGPRALLLVSDGFDADPEKFYRSESVRRKARWRRWPWRPRGRPRPWAGRRCRCPWATRPAGPAAVPQPAHAAGARRRHHHPRPQEAGAPRSPPPLPSLLAPDEPLLWLAEATGGEVVLEAPTCPPLSPTCARASRCATRRRGSSTAVPTPSRCGPARPDLTVRARRWDVAGIPEGRGRRPGPPAPRRRGGRRRPRDLRPHPGR